MIQRIQTLYLLLVVILSILAFFLPIASFITADNSEYTLKATGLFTDKQFLMNTCGLSVALLAILLITAATILFYKKRRLQIRLSIANIIIMLAHYGILFVYLGQAEKLLNVHWKLAIGSAFPAICIILCLTAIRSIKKDEALVKSLYRIR